MSESVNRDHLIEIGDPHEDGPDPVAVAPPAPHVVIEYRDRGLPWMLVLPLMVTAASVAVIGLKAFDRRTRPQDEPATVVAPPAATPTQALPAPKPNGDASTEPLRLSGLGHRDLGPPVLPPPVVPSLPAEVATTPVDAGVAPKIEAASPLPVAEATPPVATTEPASAPDNPPGPTLVKEFGIDLEALERAEVKPDEIRQPAKPPEPAPAAANPDQPRAVNPEVLPVDPRIAVRERLERNRQEILKNDAERVKFHADLRAILKRFDRNQSGPIIVDLCRRYGFEPHPAARTEATRLFNGRAAGASRRARVEVFRSLGWPEAAILLDMVNHQSKLVDKTAREGPRNENDVIRSCALFLLGIPPRPPATPPAR